MSIIWLLLAFGLGLAAKQFRLPPMLGYLFAGFLLHALGYQKNDAIDTLADTGITLMLFTIGLKVNLKELMRPAIWGTTSVNMLGWFVVVVPLMLFAGAYLGVQLFDLDLESVALVVFALSFSSTVCVIKVLEDNSELKTKHSDLSISVLIIQDLVAVLFLFAATGKTPSPWSVPLILCVFLRPLINHVYGRVGHGELVPLSGIVMAFGGAAVFEALGLKGDLGALAAGMLLAGLPHTSEVYKSLISFKDIFLIGFFLSIGFTALPTLEMWGAALLVCGALMAKFVLFFFVIAALGFRIRTAFLSGIILSNFSEFGLIVASLSVDKGWLSKEWLVIIALATAISFLVTSITYQYAHRIYAKYKKFMLRFERSSAARPPGQCPSGVEILIVGMGRVGLGAYNSLSKDYGDRVWGLEVDPGRTVNLRNEGYQIMTGDGDDIEFWETVPFAELKLVMLALPSPVEMKNIIQQLQAAGYRGKLSVVARYPDEQDELIALGADVAFNYYSEVGTGFADESRHLLAK